MVRILILLEEWIVLPCTESCSLLMENFDFHIILNTPVLMLVSGVANRVSACLVNGSLKCLPVGTGVIGILRYAGAVLERLGTTLCRPHACLHCGAEVNHLGTHGLSCVRSEGRHHQHAALNDIVHRALIASHIPSRRTTFRSDGKRPNDITVVPWKSGRLSV